MVAALTLGNGTARANVVRQLHLNFTNGGVIDDALTFKYDHSSLKAVSGTRVGGTRVFSPNYGTVQFDWTWYAPFGDPSADEDGNLNTLEDYPMQGSDINNSDFTQIGLSWFAPVTGSAPVLNLNAYRAHACLDNFHRILSYLFGLGRPAQQESSRTWQPGGACHPCRPGGFGRFSAA